MTSLISDKLRARVFAFPEKEILTGRNNGELLRLFFESSLRGVSGLSSENTSEIEVCFSLNEQTQSLAARLFTQWSSDYRFYERSSRKKELSPPHVQFLLYKFGTPASSWLCSDMRPTGAGEVKYWGFDEFDRPQKGHVVRFAGEVLTGGEVMGRMTKIQ